MLVVYLAATTAVLLVGAARVPAAPIAIHVAVLAAFAGCTWAPMLPAWLRRWAPLMALLFLYTELPSLIRAAGHTSLLDATVIAWEQALFGMQPARVWAQSWPSAAVSELLHGAYLSYYAIIVAVPALLYLGRRMRDFDESVFVMTLTFVVCFAIYVCFPVAGPRYLWPPSFSGPGRLHDGGVLRSAAVALLEARSSRGTAFPSSHVAVAVTQSVLAYRYFGRRGLVVAALAVGLAAGAVYGGFHYAVDVIAGAAVGLGTCALGLAIARRLPRQAKAIAPTY